MTEPDGLLLISVVTPEPTEAPVEVIPVTVPVTVTVPVFCVCTDSVPVVAPAATVPVFCVVVVFDSASVVFPIVVEIVPAVVSPTVTVPDFCVLVVVVVFVTELDAAFWTLVVVTLDPVAVVPLTVVATVVVPVFCVDCVPVVEPVTVATVPDVCVVLDVPLF